MDAQLGIRRISRRTLAILLFACQVLFALAFAGHANGATFQTSNFRVSAPDASFARQVAEAAEEYRAKLAVLWLGGELRNWSEPCAVSVAVGADIAAGGETVFTFQNGEVYDWKMKIQGSRERILDSVLPHEITHTILASYLRAPAPRWIDEGMATSVEANTERSHYRSLLASFLHNRRGIPFNSMISMKEYPSDLTPFYAQAFSVCEYLILVGGEKRLVEFAKFGCRTNDWTAALKMFYQCDSLGSLQLEWVEWVQRWDMANQPSVLPETKRKLLPYESLEEGEKLIAQSSWRHLFFQDSRVASDRTLAQNAVPTSKGFLDNFRRSDRSAFESQNSAVTRGQASDNQRNPGFFSGMSRVFGGQERASDRTQGAPRSTQHEPWSQNFEDSSNSPNAARSEKRTAPSYGSSVLSSGAGSASRTDNSVSRPQYYSPLTGTAYQK